MVYKKKETSLKTNLIPVIYKIENTLWFLEL